jgi:hypothetical protein
MHKDDSLDNETQTKVIEWLSRHYKEYTDPFLLAEDCGEALELYIDENETIPEVVYDLALGYF